MSDPRRTSQGPLTTEGQQSSRGKGRSPGHRHGPLPRDAGDRLLGQVSSRPVSVALGVGCCFALILALLATIPNQSPGEHGISGHSATHQVLLDVNESRREYLSRAAELALPIRSTWPASPKLLRRARPGERFEVGVGRQEAELYFYCAWASAHSRPEMKSQVATALRVFETMNTWKEIDANGKELFRRMRTRFEHGDTHPLQEYYAENCT